ncbi:MAG: fructokinase, partial [Planctomycetes bacterium]|nr:fructokinase [Planctomycetota bacterium]
MEPILVGIDLGGTKIQVAAADRRGQPLRRWR